ncbi:MAG: tRNA (N(6)-L-threonylcarbamoyladenosine(37)-C(2))-methylthiotransferase MtaB [Clostridiales bacterium]|jgi:threonylcarbamoyladenosine tRNA methylthiotransferase MtaB|nr:tRNA (N(6)-L-threonylcarbamoyladenosine(37)-C(2))-methylthiotransferase MtaB [Clostridiales bacterium]
MSAGKPLRAAALTLGCKVNAYDTEVMLGLLSKAGYEIVPFDSEADVYIINTCTVTNTGDKKSRQMARRAASMNSRAVIALCGCYAQVNPEEAKNIPGVSLVLGSADRGRIVDAIDRFIARGSASEESALIMDKREYEPVFLSSGAFSGKTRAYLKIEDGCHNFCSYCIIPYARGPARSRRPEDALAEARRLASGGVKEIVLTGIHVASYGKDLKNADLAGLISKIHEIDGIERLRLSSIEPGFMDSGFLEKISALPKVCCHFHLSLQSGCDKTLKAMNRRYDTHEYSQSIDRIRERYPEANLTTDMIAGFPGETEEDFMESYEFARQMKFSKIHAFPYSPKKGTPAASFAGQIPRAEKARRQALLLELSDEAGKAYHSQFIGQSLPVLFECEADTDIYDGHAANYMKVRAACSASAVNQILNVKIVSAGKDLAEGEIVQR